MVRKKEKIDETGKRRRWGCIAVIVGVLALLVIVVAVLTYIVLHQIPETPKETFFNPALDGFVQVELTQQDFGLQSALHRVLSTFNQRHPNEKPTSMDQINGFIDFLLYRRIYFFFDNDAETRTLRFLVVLNFKRLGPVIHFFTRKSLKQLPRGRETASTSVKYPIFQDGRGRLFYAFTKSSLLISNNMEMLKQGILQQDESAELDRHPSMAFQHYLDRTPHRGIAQGFLLNTNDWFGHRLSSLTAEAEPSEYLVNLYAQLQQANITMAQITGLQAVVELQSFEALKASVSFDCSQAPVAERLATLLHNTVLPSLEKYVEKDVQLKTELERHENTVVVTLDVRGIEKFLDQLAAQINP